MGVIKTKTLFDHIKNLFNKSVTWEQLTESDRKSFSVFMVNRFLSMDMELIGFVNMLQPYTMQLLEPKLVYKLYQDLLPKQKGFYAKYIKSSTNSKKYNSDLISMIASSEELSRRDVNNLLTMLFNNDTFKDIVTAYLRAYGKTDSEIKKLIKIEK